MASLPIKNLNVHQLQKTVILKTATIIRRHLSLPGSGWTQDWIQLAVVSHYYMFVVLQVLAIDLFQNYVIVMAKAFCHFHWGRVNIDIRLLIGIGNGITRPVYYLYNWRHWLETRRVLPKTALKGLKIVAIPFNTVCYCVVLWSLTVL